MIISLDGENIRLKDELIELGYHFPCAGMGMCGKCRITVDPNYPVSNLDKKFLTREELSAGVRLACDKIVKGELEIYECSLPLQSRTKKLESPCITVLFGPTHTTICLVDGEIVDTVCVDLTPNTTSELRSLVSKNSIEFFEEYGIPKAVTILLAGSFYHITAFIGNNYNSAMTGDFSPASLFDMPSEEVYILPVVSQTVGSDLLLDIYDISSSELIIIPEDGVFAFSSGTSIIVTKIEPYKYNLPSDKLEFVIKFINSTYTFFLNEFEVKSSRLIIRENCDLDFKSFDIVPKRTTSKALSIAVEATIANGMKTKLSKVARKIFEISVLDYDNFHKILANFS
ncbi:MAG: 2Fe-2S iron-sulfur cluster binding domain-containing protein [Christensenellaceae bacterium]|jgi:ferredoxin|nr:2Fe-2S iron-sulfur cluster binding domain-containing protein [Christensenellaceae bacterium]